MKNLTALDIVKITLTSTVGSAVLFSHADFARLLNSSSGALCVLLAAGATTLIQSLCYAELAATVPGGGGDASYIKKAFSENTALFYTLCSCCAILPASAAFSVSSLFDALPYSTPLLRLAFVASTLCLFYIPARAWHWVLQLFFYMKVCCLALLAVLIASSLGGTEKSFLATNWGETPAWSDLAVSFVNCTYFFSGYNSCNYVASASDLTRPYVAAVLLVTLIYTYFAMGHMAVFGRSQLVGTDTLAAMLRTPLCALFSSPDAAQRASGAVSAAVKCVMHLGPLFGCHTVFRGIVSDALQGLDKAQRPYCLNAAYAAYGAAVFVVLETNGSLAILNSTSILMSCFYCLTLAALLRLRSKTGCRRSILVPASALLMGAGSACLSVYSKLT